MKTQSISEKEAQGETKNIYNALKQALGCQHIPIFFTYIAPFHEYFTYITQQLIDNLKDEKFISIVSEMKQKTIPLIKEKLEKGEEIKEWISRYQYSSSFYYFQQNIDSIFIINLKLAFIFIALREAVKGWAIAAKKLTSSFSDEEKKSTDIKEEEFIYDLSEMMEYEKKRESSSNILATRQYGLVRSQPAPMEKDLLSEYLNLCRIDFSRYMKKDYFWILRIGLEKMILQTLPILPQLISSPINVVLRLTEKYDSADLIYYLAEHFPVYSVHRMMFSGFIK